MLHLQASTCICNTPQACRTLTEHSKSTPTSIRYTVILDQFMVCLNWYLKDESKNSTVLSIITCHLRLILSVKSEVTYSKSAVEDLTMAIQLASACSFAYYNHGVSFHELRDYELVTFLFISPLLHLLFQISNACRIIYTETYTNAGWFFITTALLHLHFNA